jgi:long-chain acyl-CoA synthetase
MKTLNEMWLNSFSEFSDRKAICVRHSCSIKLPDGKKSETVSYTPTTYQELESMIADVGRGLIKLGLNEREGVGIIGENCIRWIICDLAVLGNRAYNVPRGSSSTRDEILYILTHAEVKIVIVGDEKELQRVLQCRKQLPKLSLIIVLDQEFKDTNISENIYSFDYVLNLGKHATDREVALFNKRRNDTLPSDIATIMYTSGTSGTPKGIPLTHSNIMHNVETLPFMLHLNSSDRFLSILPIWHTFERTMEYILFRVGGSLWYTSPLTILKDFPMVNPTYLVSVPRIWISIYKGVMAKVRRSGKKELFDRIYHHSLKLINAKRYRQHRQYLLAGEESGKNSASPADYLFHLLGNLLIYRRMRKKLGNNFTAGISGGGSLPEYIDDFFEVLGVTLLEGYGLTETSPVVCVRTFEHRIPYTVGRPLPQTDMKVLDEDGKEVPPGEKGAVWVHGPQVMKGYYKNPEETARVMVKDSKNRLWFNTGDLGRETRDGDITILGRIKDTIVLIGGENIEPEQIEKTLKRSEYIDQVMVCGQDQEYLTALIVPDEKMIKEECAKLNMACKREKIKELCKNEKLKKVYLKIIEGLISEENGFKEIELIHHIAFTEPFTPESGTLTTTLKIKRHEVQKRDGQPIRDMYPHYNEEGKIKECG